jgi:putative ABC transport system permease protein
VRSDIQSRLRGGATVKPWTEVAVLYQQITKFNEVQNRIMAFIILSLILLGILNTIGMSVFERTGEIGHSGRTGRKQPHHSLAVFAGGRRAGIAGRH